MVTRFASLTQKVTGWLLGSCAVGAQVGNVLICVALLVFGPGVIF
jgi:hypothetical protein